MRKKLESCTRNYVLISSVCLRKGPFNVGITQCPYPTQTHAYILYHAVQSFHLNNVASFCTTTCTATCSVQVLQSAQLSFPIWYTIPSPNILLLFMPEQTVHDQAAHAKIKHPLIPHLPPNITLPTSKLITRPSDHRLTPAPWHAEPTGTLDL